MKKLIDINQFSEQRENIHIKNMIKERKVKDNGKRYTLDDLEKMINEGK